MESRGKVSLKDIKKCIEEVKFDISKGPQNPAHSWIKRVDFLASSKEEFDYYEGKESNVFGYRKWFACIPSCN